MVYTGSYMSQESQRYPHFRFPTRSELVGAITILGPLVALAWGLNNLSATPEYRPPPTFTPLPVTPALASPGAMDYRRVTPTLTALPLGPGDVPQGQGNG